MAGTKLKAVIGIGANLSSTVKGAFTNIDKRISGTASNMRELNSGKNKLSAFKRLSGDVSAMGVSLTAARNDLLKTQSRIKSGVKVTTTMRRELTKQQSAVKRLETAYSKKRKQLAGTNTDLKKLGINTRKLSSEEARLTAETEKANAKLKKLGARKKALSGISKGFGEIKRKAIAAGVGIMAAGVSLKKTVFDSAQFGDEAAKTAASLGTTTDQLLAMRYAGEHMGMSMGTMDGALSSLRDKLQAARDGSAEARRAFAELNVDPEVLSMMSLEEQMKVLSGSFQNYHGRIDKNVLITKVFGSSAVRMGKMMEQSSEQWQEWNNQARKSGYVMSDAQASMSESFQDSLGSLRAAVTGMRMQISTRLMPPFIKVMDFFTNHTWALKAAFVAVGVAISAGAVVAVGSLGLKAIRTGREMKALLVTMNLLKASSAGGGLGKALGGAKAGGGIMASLKGVIPMISKFTGVILPGLLGTVQSVMGGISAAIIGIPGIGWIIGAIALVAFLVYKYWKPIKAFVTGLFGGMFGVVKDTIGEMIDAGRPFFDAYMKFASPIIGVFKSLWGWVSKLFKPMDATGEQLDKISASGARFGKVIATVVLAPVKALLATLKGVKWALNKLGIGDSEEVVEGGSTSANSGKVDRSNVSEWDRRLLEQKKANIARRRDPNRVHSWGGYVPDIPSGGGGNTSKVETNKEQHFHFNVPTGTDTQAVAAEVARQIKEHEDDENRRTLTDWS